MGKEAGGLASGPGSGGGGSLTISLRRGTGNMGSGPAAWFCDPSLA